MTDLKCCPFCGGKATLKRDQKDDFVEWSVGCYNRGCVCSAHTYCYDNKDDAIRDWNTRKPMDNIVEKLEELKEKGYAELTMLEVNELIDKAINIVKKEINKEN